MAIISCPSCDKKFSEFAPECPFCKGLNMETGTLRDQYSGPEFLPSESVQKTSEISGFILHVLPWAGFLLLMFLSPIHMNKINWLVIILSAVLMALESGQRGKHGMGSAILWFIGAIVLWVVIYPVYMFRRARYGMATNGLLCLLGTLFLTGISLKHAWTIITQHGGI